MTRYARGQTHRCLACLQLLSSWASPGRARPPPLNSACRAFLPAALLGAERLRWKEGWGGGSGCGCAQMLLHFFSPLVYIASSSPPPPPPNFFHQAGHSDLACETRFSARVVCVCVCVCVYVWERESLPQLNDKKELIPQMDLMTGDFHGTQCGRLSPEFLRTLQLCRRGDLNSRWVVGELNITDYINMSHKAGEESWQKH